MSSIGRTQSEIEETKAKNGKYHQIWSQFETLFAQTLRFKPDSINWQTGVSSNPLVQN